MEKQLARNLLEKETKIASNLKERLDTKNSSFIPPFTH
jgi:hypothetical protein